MGGSREKWRSFERKSACIFGVEWGRERKTPSSSFSSPAKVEIGAIGEEILPVKLIFSAKTEISGKKISRAGEKNTPKKVVFAPKVVESDEKGSFGRKSQGGDEAKKWTLLPILPCYEVAKWAQMKFSRIFFRGSLAGNAEMPYLCTRNREATLLQERVTL